MACWRVLSLQLTSSGSSSQCTRVGPSSARWNDKRNDILAVSSEEDPPQSVLAVVLGSAMVGRRSLRA
jgi:hypothetical protein